MHRWTLDSWQKECCLFYVGWPISDRLTAAQVTDGKTFFYVLGHLLRDDLINPVKMSVRPYVRTYIRTYVGTSTIKLNAATNQIVVFVNVDETFTTFKVIRGQGQGHVRLKVSKITIFKFYLLRHFSTNQKNPTVSDTRPKYLKSLGPDFWISS